MIRVFVLAALLTGLAISPRPSAADEPPKKPTRKDAAADLLHKLHHQQVTFDANPGDSPLAELLGLLGKRYEVTFVIREKAFRDAGTENIRDAKANLTATKFEGISLHQFLSTLLDDIGATYLIRAGYLEIVPVEFAAKEAKFPTDEDGITRMDCPLVSAIYKEKPFNEAVAELAELYDLNVVIAPQSADNKTGFVSARLLNVPADKALELLAVQADLRVVRKGNAFLITSTDHANGLFAEQLDKERQRAEIQRLKITPLAPPANDK